MLTRTSSSRCTAEYCTDDTGECVAESGICFLVAEESRDPDRRGVYEVVSRGCSHVNESIFFCSEGDNNIGHQVLSGLFISHSTCLFRNWDLSLLKSD